MMIHISINIYEQSNCGTDLELIKSRDPFGIGEDMLCDVHATRPRHWWRVLNQLQDILLVRHPRYYWSEAAVQPELEDCQKYFLISRLKVNESFVCVELVVVPFSL